ncbi:hypothetical protein PQX77_015979 [Marasmius sp. AFHP31]|nr:hypothetical protein PQX77_015979 [Marasmius sp. AFHP31]
MWIKLIAELQVKSEVIQSAMKDEWNSMVCVADADLVKFLDESSRMAKKIRAAGGDVSDSEERSHILTRIPEVYQQHINTVITSASVMGYTVPTATIVDSLKRHYRYLTSRSKPAAPKTVVNNTALAVMDRAPPRQPSPAFNNGRSGNRGGGPSRRSYRGRGRGSVGTLGGFECFKCGG